jgi:hypothetical protein
LDIFKRYFSLSTKFEVKKIENEEW